MAWFAQCADAQIKVSSASKISYNGRMASHRCSPSVMHGYGVLAIEAFEFATKVNLANGEWSITGYDRTDTMNMGLLGHVHPSIYEPILSDHEKAQCLIWYLAPSDGYPDPAISFQAILPKPQFEVIGELIQHHMFGKGTILDISVEFLWFSHEPTDRLGTLQPSLSQFLGTHEPYPAFNLRPYVAENPTFRFYTGSPTSQP